MPYLGCARKMLVRKSDLRVNKDIMLGKLSKWLGRLSVGRKLMLIYLLDLTAVIYVSGILINEKFLSIDFARDPLNPKDEVHQQDLQEKYPQIRAMGIRGSENPNLLPKGAITVRMHSVGGWGAITTGKNLAMTLYELLGWDIKANPKYGSEKKGQPTTYYLSAAPEPIPASAPRHAPDSWPSPGVPPRPGAGGRARGR